MKYNRKQIITAVVVVALFASNLPVLASSDGLMDVEMRAKEKTMLKNKTPVSPLLLDKKEKKDKMPYVKYKKFKGNFKDIKAQYKKELEFYKKSRKQILNLKDKRAKIKNQDDLRAVNKEAKSYLLRILNVLSGKLESLKTWVQNNNAYSDETKQNIISEIDEDLRWIAQKAEEVENADELSKEEIRKNAKEIREYWLKYRVKIKRLSGVVLSHRVDALIMKAEKLADRVEDKIDVLKEKDVDTSELEAWLDEFKEDIDKAKEKVKEAKDKYREIDSLPEADRYFRRGHDMSRDVLKMIREGHRELRDIIRDIKSQLDK